MSQHTPGPWTEGNFHNNGIDILAPNGKRIALCNASDTWIPDNEARDNASLIAAAPALLAALKSIKSMNILLIAKPEAANLIGGMSMVMAQADQALAQAE